MLVVLITIALVAFSAALAALVFARARSGHNAWMFVLVVALVVVLNANSWLQTQARSAEEGYWLGAVAVVVLALLALVLLLMFSLLFMPQWWRGRRPVIWISLPYVGAALALAADLGARSELIIGGVRLVDSSYRLFGARPGGTIMLALFSLGWMVQLGMLLVAFARNRQLRVPVGLLFGAIALSLVGGLLSSALNLPSSLSLLSQTVPLISALSYAVLRSNLLSPTGAVLDLTLQTISDAVVVTNLDGGIAYANAAAARLHMVAGRPLAEALTEAGGGAEDLAALLQGGATSRELSLGERRIAAARTLIESRRGRPLGWLLVGRDITEAARRLALLEQERAALAETVRQLEDERRERAQLAEVVRQVATPVIPVMSGVLAVPLVGDLDAARAEGLSATVLRAIEAERARVVILDITGVPLLDAAGAAHLMSAVQAAGLLGARCVLAGVRPEIAQSLVALGVDLGALRVAATLREALAAEIASGHAPEPRYSSLRRT